MLRATAATDTKIPNRPKRGGGGGGIYSENFSPKISGDVAAS